MKSPPLILAGGFLLLAAPLPNLPPSAPPLDEEQDDDDAGDRVLVCGLAAVPPLPVASLLPLIAVASASGLWETKRSSRQLKAARGSSRAIGPSDSLRNRTRTTTTNPAGKHSASNLPQSPSVCLFSSHPSQTVADLFAPLLVSRSADPHPRLFLARIVPLCLSFSPLHPNLPPAHPILLLLPPPSSSVHPFSRLL